jgi:hypothetical protein
MKSKSERVAKAQEAVDKSLQHKLIAAAMAEASEEPIVGGGAAMQPSNINPNPKPNGEPVISAGPYSLTNSLN